MINLYDIIDLLSLKILAHPVNIGELRKLNKSYAEVLLL